MGMLCVMLCNVEDACDALQESFLKCWRTRERIASVQNLRAWIFKVAVNTGRDVRQTAWRRRRQNLTGEDAMLKSTTMGPDVEAQQDERLALARRALRELRPEEQEVFLMRQNGELTYDDIGRELGLPVGTVKTRMRLAVSKLRQALAGA